MKIRGIPVVAATVAIALAGAITVSADTYTYDPLNRLTKVAYSDGSSIDYTYDAAGNITQIQNIAAPVDGVCGSSNGQTFTTAPTSSLCSVGTATAVTGTGPWTWSCVGTDGGTTAGCSANIQTYSLSVTLAGTGGGSVHSSPLTDISCIKGSSSGCSASFDADTVVSLTATPDSITSTFGGWSGACSAAPCNITMNADKNVTATFTLAPLTKNKTTNTAYATLAQALATAASGAELLVLGTQHDGAVSLNTSIILNGGWSPAYLAKSGLPSTLNGNLSILGGNSSAEDLMVKGQLVIQGGSLRVNEVTVRP